MTAKNFKGVEVAPQKMQSKNTIKNLAILAAEKIGDSPSNQM